MTEKQIDEEIFELNNMFTVYCNLLSNYLCCSELPDMRDIKDIEVKEDALDDLKGLKDLLEGLYDEVENIADKYSEFI